MWQGIEGHDEIVELFRRTLGSGRLASTYLFVGPEGIGKRAFALALSRCLLCVESADEELTACGQCESCRLLAAGNHPDLLSIGLPEGKSSLPISLFIGDEKEPGLCHNLSLRPYLSTRKIAIIDDADDLNPFSANSLLKTLEEPPNHSLLILIGTALSKQLPTVRSRAQIIRFRPLSKPLVKKLLIDSEISTDEVELARLAELSEGSLARAQDLARPELWEIRAAILERLARPTWDLADTEKMVQQFVQDSGKEAALRRDALRTVVGFVLAFYEALVRRQMGSADVEEQSLRRIVQRACESLGTTDIELCLHRMDACLDALEQVDRNANQGLVISHWLHSLTAPTPSIV